MATGKTNYRPAPASHMIRPALVEAMLITQKRASDPVYVVTLTEELRNIEAKIAAMEGAADTGLSATVQFGPDGASEDLPDADWIRSKSSELGRRLDRIVSTEKAAISKSRS
jgi:hypothetical protein